MNLRTTQGSREHRALISAGLQVARGRQAAGEGFMYVAAIDGTDAIKIGFSLDPQRRIRSLGATRYRLLGFFPCSVDAERRFHAAHATRRHPDYKAREIYRRSLFTHAHPEGLDA